MISTPLALFRCDGPASEPRECASVLIVQVGWLARPAEARAIFNALHRTWLATEERVRCPHCIGIDVENAGKGAGR